MSGRVIVTLKGMPGYWEVLEETGDRLVVNRGALRMAVKRSQVLTEGAAKEKKEGKLERSQSTQRYDKAVPDFLDLHGQTVEDALQRLESYLDDAVAAGHRDVLIVHGHGTRALEKAIRAFLGQRRYRFEIGQLSKKGVISQRVFLA